MQDEETAKHLVPGRAALALCDMPLLVPHPDTARVQEAHQFLPHCLMDRIEAGLRS